MPIPLQPSIVYGPIESRRFGRSLGINLLPTGHKVCNFDCLYCQYGLTPHGIPSRFPDLGVIEREVEASLARLAESGLKLDWIMLSGNGEPTLHARFGDLVPALIEIRNRLFPGVPLGILSNASTCHRPEIRSALLELDGRFMKLDAGREELFKALNQPTSAKAWPLVLDGLRSLKSVVLQSLFVSGVCDNTTPLAIGGWLDALRYVKPESVQLYSLDRPAAADGLRAVSREILEGIAGRVRDEAAVDARVCED